MSDKVVASKAVALSERDNVATALEELVAGEGLAVRVGSETLRITLAANVAFGHKFSLRSIPRGAEVIKYGEVIGVATTDITPGEHVHVHNVASTRGRGDLAGGAR